MKFLDSFKQSFSSIPHQTLDDWQRASCQFVFVVICVFSVPALINSVMAAVRDGLWVNLFAYGIAYLFCLAIAFARTVPFKIRAWTGVIIFLALGTLSIFSTGPWGSGRIWFYSTSIFATLILGIRAGMIILAAQALVLTVFYSSLVNDHTQWLRLELYSPKIWITTSITFLFLSILSILAMGRLIRGISAALAESQKANEAHEQAARQLAQRIKDHNQTIHWLKESEERWHFALEGAGDGVVDWNLEAGKVFFSRRWKKILGYSEPEVGHGIEEWFDRIHPEDQEAFHRYLEDHLQGQSPIFQFRHRLCCKDGNYKWIFARAKAINRGHGGKPARVIGIHTDITVIKQMEARQIEYESRLQQAQKMEAIGTLAGGIAHDFNNILFPILGHTEMLMEDLKGSEEEVTESLNQIHISALRAKELVQQILAFSRQDQAEYRQTRIQLILKETVKLLRSTIPSSIEIKKRIDPDCPAVNADAIQIHQLIMNLATNAFHAMAETGGELLFGLDTVRLSSEDSGQLGVAPGLYVCLSVTDSGEGIPPDLLPRIFDPFFTTKEKGKGTGMGLSVVHGIVKAMKGGVNVYSEPGKGSKFRLYLPANTDESWETVLPDLDHAACPQGNERILILDDEEAVLEMERLALKRLGYQVTILSDPLVGLETFRKAPDDFDLILTDMTMPKLSGREVAQGVKSIRPDIPVILLTGFSDRLTSEAAQDMGFSAMVLKPVILQELAENLRQVLDRP